MLAIACLIVCGPALAVTDVPHSPITTCANGTNALTTPYGAPVTYSGSPQTATGAGSLPIFALVVLPESSPPTYDYPVTSWPAAGSWDFCAAFDTASCSLSTISAFSTDIDAYVQYFRCGTDLNGPPDANPEAAAWPLTGNGIPDGEYELGLLAAVLNNTYALNPARTGGVTNAQVLAVFQANFNYFKVMLTKAWANVQINPPPAAPSDLRSMIPGLMPWYPSALVTILAGYATEGDVDSIAALNALIGLEGQANPSALSLMGLQWATGDVGAHTTGFSAILGPNGDADGDCFTNHQEYNYFHSQGAAATIAAQLNQSIYPPPIQLWGTIAINGQLSVTNSPQVTLALKWARWTCADVVQMRFSDDGAHWTAWEPVKSTRAYTLSPPDGYKTIRVQFLDKVNSRSPVLYDYIRLDTTPPTGRIVGDAWPELVGRDRDRRHAHAFQR
jgi:hypothetical protein